MRRTTITVLALLAVASMAVVAVWAANPHYKKGPSCVDNGLTATCTGTIAGLGNGNVLAILNFPNATGTTTCTSPGGHQAPGQNPATPAPVSGTASVGNPKNGTLSFTVTTDPPANPTPQAAGCPNGNWTAAFNNITFGNGTLTIQQDQCPPNGCYVTVLTNNVSLP
jgi:hypothetical protein